MKIVIIGAGEVGVQIARQLISEGKDVIIIEKNADIAKHIGATLDCIVIHGEGTNIEVLKDAGISLTDVFIAATTSDEVNLIACFIVSAEFNVPIKIARIANASYSKISSFSNNVSGVDYLVNTDTEAAWEIFQTLEQGAASSIISFDNPAVQMRDFIVEKDKLMDNISLKDLRGKIGEEFVVAGVQRGDELFVPDGNFVLQAGDHIYMVSLISTFYKIYKRIGSKTHKLRKIAVLGATPVGLAVTEMLLSKGRSVVVVDKDYAKCKHVAEILPDAMVLNGDISENEIYEDEGVAKVDAIVTTTLNEELNIISGIYAKTIGVKRAIALVDKTSYLKLAPNLGIDSTVSKKYCAINSIVKAIRRGRVRSVHVVFEGKAEAVEVAVPEKSPLVGVPLKTLLLPKGTLILSVEHDRKTIIPKGDTVLKPNDNIIVLLLRDNIPTFEKYLV